MTMALSRPARVRYSGHANIAVVLKSCLDILSELCCLKALEEEWPLLQARIDVERTLLLQWAHKFRLLEPGRAGRLDRAVRDEVYRLLCNAENLYMDIAQLKARFKIEMYAQEDSLPGSTYLTGSLVLSKARMDHFNNEFSRQELRLLQTHESPTFTTKFIWVVNDVEGFEKFVEIVGQLVNALNRLASNPNSLDHASQMASEDVRRVRTMDDLRLVRDAAKGVRDTIAHSAEHLIVYLAQRRCLKNLWFRGMQERRVSLNDPHPKTFEWALRSPDPETDVEWDSLIEWLESGSRIYWVCGKAGAGKSTLFRFLYNHHETRSRLTKWGGREEVSIGSYFFWRMGSHLQRTRDGMGRAVLHHILSEIPSIIPLILPNMWHYAYTGSTYESHEMLPQPSIPEVRMAFEKMAEDGVLTKRFCFFVDGLDEYEGDESRAVAFIQKLTLSPKIKVVASSRPHPAFVESFADTPKLHLHDLNGLDILDYVQDKADAHLYMDILREVDETMALILVETLAEKACGGFLWAILGTKAFLRGFDAYETARELEQRIEDIPVELEDLYVHMLSLVHPRHRQEAAKILRVCYRSKQEQSAESERGRTWTLGLAAVGENDMDFDNFEVQQERSLHARQAQCIALETRLASRCGGLLEVTRTDGDELMRCFCPTPRAHPHHDIVIDSSIEFIHRTVFEWLGRPGTWNIPYLQLEDDSFAADTALSSMSWHQCRMTQELGTPFGRQDVDMSNCVHYMKSAEKFTDKFADNILRNIHELVTETREKRGDNWRFSFCCSPVDIVDKHLETLYFAVGMGMVNLVRHYIKRNPDGPSLRELELKHKLRWWNVATDRSLVAHFLEPYYEAIRHLPPKEPMQQFLTEAGCIVPTKEGQKYVPVEPSDRLKLAMRLS